MRNLFVLFLLKHSSLCLCILNKRILPLSFYLIEHYTGLSISFSLPWLFTLPHFFLNGVLLLLESIGAKSSSTACPPATSSSSFWPSWRQGCSVAIRPSSRIANLPKGFWFFVLDALIAQKNFPTSCYSQLSTSIRIVLYRKITRRWINKSSEITRTPKGKRRLWLSSFKSAIHYLSTHN